MFENITKAILENKKLSDLTIPELLLYKSETTYYLTKVSTSGFDLPYRELVEDYSKLAKQIYKSVLSKVKELSTKYFSKELDKDEFIKELKKLYRKETKDNNKWLYPMALLAYNFAKKDISDELTETSFDRLVSRKLSNDVSYYLESYLEKYQIDKVEEYLDNAGDSEVDFNRNLEILWDGESDIASPGGFGKDGSSYAALMVLYLVGLSRSFGSVQGMFEKNITRYRIQEIDDEKTCDFCRYINGTEFEVSDGLKLRDMYVSKSNPDDIKDIIKWANSGEIQNLAGSDLIDRGLCLPPYHIRCRGKVIPVN